jgi:hypothetical protein
MNNAALVAMRLIDMHRVHPHQDNTRVCSRCGERVGVYPSGQQALRHNRKIKIICVVCVSEEESDDLRPAASPAEIIQEARDSTDVGEG